MEMILKLLVIIAGTILVAMFVAVICLFVEWKELMDLYDQSYKRNNESDEEYKKRKNGKKN